MKKNLKSFIAAALMLSAAFSMHAARAGKVISRDSAKTKTSASKKTESRSLEIPVSLEQLQLFTTEL